MKDRREKKCKLRKNEEDVKKGRREERRQIEGKVREL